ncbi:hypothetical protein RHGRI_001127 [Rhododendron griersonianum]|uniref:Uncharacterized protein n=1 Tax=Rhododendron griersonianum TaxID=479676 RepID=A0AAV6LKA5_9ERIC|nr:hypothetical protein RHGRI_001127 [Rhododendron griersonianum]
MEWYCGSGVDDLVVPRDQDPLDRLPSPNSWSLWGVAAPGSFESQNKHFITQTSSVEEEPDYRGKGLYEEVDMDYSAEHSSDSNLCQGFHNGSLQQATSSWESPDYELSDLARNNQADDIFMSSLLEEGPTGADNMRGSFNFIPEFGYGVLPTNNLLTDMVTESDYDPSHLFGMGSSKYVKTHAFSPSMNWGHGEVTPCNLRQKDDTTLKVRFPFVYNFGKWDVAFVARFAASSEFEMNELVNEETSIEASILHELQGAMVQLSEKTRICFRDAFYRLAKNSKQYMEDHSQNGDLVSDTVHDETLRSENTKTVESETNSVDRAIANLLFNKTGSVQESNGSARLCNYNLSLTQPPHYPLHTRLSSDALVPIFSTKEKPSAGGDCKFK